jgi:hypothetical protein
MTSPIGSHSPTMSGWPRLSRSGENITSGDKILSQDFNEFIQSSNYGSGRSKAIVSQPSYATAAMLWRGETRTHSPVSGL